MKVASLSPEFERQKNTQALVYTAAVTIAILLLLFLVQWSIKISEPEVAEETIEINLGNADVGSGTDQPELPGDPAPAEQAAYTPPQPVQATSEDVKDLTDENETSNDAPAIAKPVNSKPDARKIEESKTPRPTSPSTPQPVVQAPVVRPRATLGRTVGGSGNGGNGAETYRPGTGEGIGGGQGDQGQPGGSPNGTAYSGTPRNLGNVRIISIPSRTYEDDFTQSGKVFLDVVVNANGKLVSATYQPRNSTITNRSQIEIAKKRAAEYPWPKMENGFKQTVQFTFKVNG